MGERIIVSHSKSAVSDLIETDKAVKPRIAVLHD